MADMTLSRLLSEIRKNPELLRAVRETDDAELDGIVLEGERRLNVSRKVRPDEMTRETDKNGKETVKVSVDHTSDAIVDAIVSAVVAAGELVETHVKPVNSGDFRLGLPLRDGISVQIQVTAKKK